MFFEKTEDQARSIVAETKKNVDMTNLKEVKKAKRTYVSYRTGIFGGVFWFFVGTFYQANKK